MAVDALQSFRLDGRVAVVTGASAGLGARFARVLAGAGARVVLAARRAERIGAVADELPGAIPIPCDLTDAGDRERLVTTTLDRFGRLDVLVNNAGAGREIDSDRERIDRFRGLLEINCVAVFALSQLAARAMEGGEGGSIVNVASMYGLVAGPPGRPLAAYAEVRARRLLSRVGSWYAARRVRLTDRVKRRH